MQEFSHKAEIAELKAQVPPAAPRSLVKSNHNHLCLPYYCNTILYYHTILPYYRLQLYDLECHLNQGQPTQSAQDAAAKVDMGTCCCLPSEHIQVAAAAYTVYRIPYKV